MTDHHGPEGAHHHSFRGSISAAARGLDKVLDSSHLVELADDELDALEELLATMRQALVADETVRNDLFRQISKDGDGDG